jgi:hypothetical protein
VFRTDLRSVNVEIEAVLRADVPLQVEGIPGGGVEHHVSLDAVAALLSSVHLASWELLQGLRLLKNTNISSTQLLDKSTGNNAIAAQ